MPIENGYNVSDIHHAAEPVNESLFVAPAVQEIVSDKPGFLIQWGISIFFFILLAVIFICWFIQYPEIITTSARLTSVNPPTEIKVKINGRLTKLFVKEGDSVKQGDIIGYMESIADASEITQLNQSLKQLETAVHENNSEKIQAYVKTQYLHLGEIQAYYQLFMQAALQFAAEPQKHKLTFLLEVGTFESQLNEWSQKYLLQAPIAGHIYFSGFLSENQQLKNNQTIGFVDPGKETYFVEMNISQMSLGKVKKGQTVLLKFSAYPYQEYGSVNGEINFISTIATDSGYLAKIILPTGLTTNYQKQIYFREGLMAQGEIIIQKKSLLERFYGRVKNSVQ